MQNTSQNHQITLPSSDMTLNLHPYEIQMKFSVVYVNLQLYFLTLGL